MSEIEQYTPRAEVATYQDAAIHRLAEWATGAEAAHRVATTLVQTAFCPDQFRNKPGEATAAILAGMEMGLQPMAALRSFDIIQGAAAARAITLRAVVQAAGHEMVLVESTTTRCIMRGRRKGSSEWQQVTWTLERAQSLGVTGKDNWKKQPQAMLVARCTSELARLIASDAILGLAYSAEELADGPIVEGEQVEPVAATRRMSRRVAVEQVEPDPEPELTPDNASPLINTRSNLAKRLFASVQAEGIVKDQFHAFFTAALGREVNSASDLTDADAEEMLDNLPGLAADFLADDGGAA